MNRGLLTVDTRSRPHPIDAALARAGSIGKKELLQWIAALQSENAGLRAQLRIDSLTGICNRGALVEELQSEWRRWQRRGGEAALLLIDLNDFKFINDTHGHAAGDWALVRTARHLVSEVRATDCVARLGGDEFAVLLRDTDAGAARRVAAKLCAGAPVFAAAAAQLQVHYAIGCAPLQAGFGGVQQWLEAADADMYRHKRSTRLYLCKAAATADVPRAGR